MSQQQHIGRYEILEEIASGGQGAVYRARDVSLDRVVALKSLHPHLARNPQYRERFLREARTAASLTHPNVVTIYEVGEDGNQLFIAMEYLPRSLHDVLEETGYLDVQTAISMTFQVAAALQAGHEHNIVHRDIKPQNILVGPGDTYKVTDFGIARAGDLSTMTATGAVMGSPPYMSPEQVRGERVDIRSDIYSLGITFFNSLTGEPPFKADTPFGVLRQHTDVQPPRVRQLRNDVPRSVDNAVQRCLEKDPARRYQTPVELAQALAQAVPEAMTHTTTARMTAAPVGQQTPVSQPVAVQTAYASTVRISSSTAIVGFLLLGMLAGFVLLLFAYGEAYYGISPGPPGVLAAIGFAVGLMTSNSLLMTGRWPSLIGVVLVAVGLVLLLGSETNLQVVPISMGIYGLGLGFLLPAEMWRRLGAQSIVSRFLMTVAALGGVAMSWFLGDEYGLLETATLAGMIAVFIGLPLALMSPLVKTVSKPVPIPQGTPVSQPGAFPISGQPSETWMEAWASAWQKSNRRRFAWIGTTLTLGLGLALTLARFGVFDDIGPSPGTTGTPGPTATATASPQREPTATPVPIAGVMNTEVVWSFGVSGGAGMLLAAGDGDDLYFASEDGVVYSLDGRTGAERWRYEIGEHVSSADLAGDGLLHVGTESGSLLGLRVSDGFNIYRSAFTDENVLTAAVPGEAVYVVTETGSVQRHPPEGGPRLWALDLHSSVVAPPVVGSDGIVYVGTIDPGSVNAISPDGQLLWSVETGPVEVSPAIGSLYVATAWGQLLSFDERNGAILWEQAIETPAFPPVISHNGDVYTLGEGNLSRISPDGEYQWHSGNLTSVRYKSVAVDQDGNAYLLDRAGDLWAIDWDGSLQMLATTGAEWLAHGPDGIIYLGTEKGIAALQAARTNVTGPPVDVQPVYLEWLTSRNIPGPDMELEHRLLERIEELSGGTVRPGIVIAEEDGLEREDLFPMVSNGIVQLSTVRIADLGDWEPLALGADLPGLVGFNEEMADSGDLMTVTSRFESQLDARLQEMFDVKLLSLWPSELQVLYCRGQGGGVIGVSSFAHADLLGGLDAVYVPYDEVLPSLARGAIDCAVGGVLSGNNNRWYEIADVLFLLPMGWDFQAHVMDLHTWRELGGERQSILTQVFQEAEQALWKVASELTETGISCNTGDVDHCNTGNLGEMSLRGLASDEYSDFKRGFVSQSVIPTWVEQCGPDCAELFNATIAQVVGVKAGTFAGPTPTPTRQPTPTPTRPPTATPTPSPTPAPVPNVLFVGAEFVTADAHGQRITVPVGSIVQVYVTLESSAATEGQLEVHIVKDITLATDETKRLCGSKVSLEAGLNEVMACDFVADQLSSGSLRHYFLKVQWNGDFIHDPLDPETREALVTVVAPIVTPTVAAVTQWYVLASQIITLPPLNVLDVIASKLTLEPGEELVGTPFVLIAGKENCLITADQDSSLNVAVFDVSTGEITVQTFFVILGGDQTVCFIKSTTADSEFAAIQTAVSSMMSDNSIAALPNPSALTAGNGTGGCDTGTTLMTAFPDATSVIAVDKILDPNGGTYVEGVDPLGDKAGFLLFSHDLVAGDDQVSLVNYMSVGTTAFCYQTTADGIITQFDTDGHQTNP